jgi:hypothetical protein
MGKILSSRTVGVLPGYFFKGVVLIETVSGWKTAFSVAPVIIVIIIAVATVIIIIIIANDVETSIAVPVTIALVSRCFFYFDIRSTGDAVNCGDHYDIARVIRSK